MLRTVNRDIEYKTLEGNEYHISAGFYGDSASDLYIDGFDAYLIKDDSVKNIAVDEKHKDYKEIKEFIDKYLLDNAVDVLDDLIGHCED